MPTLFWILVAFEFGSFANVCIYRWARGKSVQKPARSSCPWCVHQISWHENIPVISSLILKFRCSNCRSFISFQYVFVEVILPFLFLPYVFCFRSVCSVLLIPFLIFVLSLIVTSLTDFEWRIIPNQMIFLVGFCGILFSYWNPILGDVAALRLFNSFSSVAVVYLLGLFLAKAGNWLWGREVLGLGDVKLLAAYASLLGTQAIFYVLLSASVIGSIIFFVMFLCGKISFKSYLPFGPFLNLASYLVSLIMFSPKAQLCLVMFWR